MIKPPMTNLTNSTATRTLKTTLFALLAAAAIASAQAPQARITGAIDNASRVTLPGSLSPRALPANDVGAVPASTKLQGITLVFSRTPAQQSALDALVAAQQNPVSPQYHQWLTPAQFGAQFGVAASDIAATEAWLQQQGFTIDGVSNSRDRIHFSGTEAQVESAFATQLHFYSSSTGNHFAPSTALSVPAALSSSVLAIANLSSFRPRSHVKFSAPVAARPNFTSGQTGSNFLDPDDVATIYDITAAYNAGYTGTGQSIVIIGQSAIVSTDITNFQSALGLTAKVPTQILVPNSGTSTIYSGDESESDLDLEYSGAIARGATINFVYTGNSTTQNVFNALEYAVDNKIAPIISSSYGDCELDLGATNYAQLNAFLQQAAIQGQTVIAAAGDDGSTDCYGDGSTTLTAAQEQSLAVDFPASIQYVTAMGGTEFPVADVAAGNTTYWTTNGTSDVLSSAKSYIPEQVWNDDAADALAGATDPLSSGGGGVSILTARPTWQAGVPGIVAGSFRLLPDISLAASPNYPGYLYCSSDTSNGINGSCDNGFRDANKQYLTVAGGTSFDAPIFAGMTAIINQAKGYSTGQGVVNSTLYTLAANPTTYATAFHDITSGSNECLAGASFCSTAGASAYVATVGYDEASGLGSLDLYNLLNAWPASSTGSLTATTLTLSAATLTPAISAPDVVTISVAPTTATGTVTLTVDGVAQSPITLTNGTATYTFSSATAGSHVIVAVYSGNTIYASSTATLTLNVGAGSLTLTATNITVAPGSSGSSTLTLTPGNGYTGTFEFLTINAPSGLTNACASDPANITITGTAPGTSSITIYTSSTSCPSGSVALVKGATGRFANGVLVKVIAGSDPASSPRRPSPLGPASSGIAVAGLLLAGIFTRRSRKLRACLSICLLGVLGLALSGCSNGNTTPLPASAVDAPAGTYQLTLAGSDTVNSSVTASANFTLTIN